MKNLIKKIQHSAYLNDLWSAHSALVVGISGGPDSVCLLDILANIKEKSKLTVHVAHVNYGLRGKDSDRDETFVRELAKKYALDCSVLQVQKQKGKKMSEEYLRTIRYDFFEQVRKKKGSDAVAVAHTSDDQVETFLMHLLRGAGLRGLSGMQYKNGNIIRPLLGISRKEVLEYIKQHCLVYRIDKTNAEDVFFRNKIRNKLIPYLEKNFNPNIRKTIFDATVHIAEDVSLISEISKKNAAGIGSVGVSHLLALHPALQKNILREMIRAAKGELKNIEASHLEEILKIVKSTKNKNQTISFQGLKLTRKGDTLNVEKVTK